MERKILLESEFEAQCSKIQDLFFVQIGANDGVGCDPIYHLVKKYNWAGLLVEPGAIAFADLQKNYQQHNNLLFENAAVTDKDGDVILYCGSTTPHFTLEYTKAVSMFDITPMPVTVSGITPQTLLKKYNISKVDLLQIDAEAHDHIILRNYPFDTHKPSIVRFEYVNLNNNYNECISLIASHNYEIFFSQDGSDIIAIAK
jgi:FkbM family methyltransferase